MSPTAAYTPEDSSLYWINCEGSLTVENPVQMLFTTHSPYMLDWFKDDMDSVLILHRKDGATTVRTASEGLKANTGQTKLNGSTLGELWYQGTLGGVPA